MCFPYAGGGAAVFRGWSEELPETVELVAVRLPGRESRLRETPIDEWPTLLEALDRSLHDVVTGPCVLLGHSLGAMIAYEMACRLSARGTRPLGLVLVGCRAPHLSRLVPDIRGLPDAEFVAGLRSFAGVPDGLLGDPRLLRLLVPMVRADLVLAETWPLGPPAPVEVPLVTFAGDTDPIATPPSVAAWKAQARAGITAHALVGGHFSIASPPDRLLRLLRPDLDAWAEGAVGRG